MNTPDQSPQFRSLDMAKEYWKDRAETAERKCDELQAGYDELLSAIKDDIANTMANHKQKSCGHLFNCICSQERLNKAIANAGGHHG